MQPAAREFMTKEKFRVWGLANSWQKRSTVSGLATDPFTTCCFQCPLTCEGAMLSSLGGSTPSSLALKNLMICAYL